MHGDKLYHVEYLPVVIRDDISALFASAKKMIKKAIEERLSVDPIGFGRPLRYSLKGHRRLRVGDYRIVYRIDSKVRIVIIIAIKHRKDVYEN